MKKSYVKYYINKKGTDKYLHTVNSGYGRVTSLTDGIVYGDWYTTDLEAYMALDRYVAKTKDVPVYVTDNLVAVPAYDTIGALDPSKINK